MEALNTVRTPVFELSYNGRVITPDIAPYARSVTYTDHLSGESDSLDIELEDSDGRWLGEWYPEKGATLAFKFGYQHQPLASAGQFDIDELELSGSPSVVLIRALAAGVQKAVRTRKGKGYEDTTLAAIAQRIAKLHKMTLVGKIDAIPIDRVSQYHESDLAFLHRLAGRYGYTFKVTENNTRLVFWKNSALHSQASIRSYTPNDLAGWRFRDKVTDVPARVEVKHHNTKTKSLVTAGVKHSETTVSGASSSGEKSSADTVKINRRAPTSASAHAQAGAEMERRLLDRTSAEISLEGDPALLAGVNIELSGFGQLSGIYLINRATHTISRSAGYTADLELKRSAPLSPKKAKKHG